MRKLSFALMALVLFSCSSKKAEVKQVTPEDVVNSIFAAAKAKDYSGLSKLCDTDADSDSKKICDLQDKDKASFEEYFSKGKIDGNATINGSEAAVPILFGPDGTKSETMNLVQKDGKWYLKSF